MNEPAIKVQNVSKLYHIGQGETHDTLRDAIMSAVASPLRRLRSFGRASHRRTSELWALKDVSLDIAPGQVVGVIGRNGAGKSTLLKILTRITRPSAGRIELRGRVGSLLEVGTGFHEELSGRENIHLSGAVLGMTRREIRASFEDIVAFSGVREFLDTPVKRYSSGMKVRLGFAVAAHLRPEILLIDEVLAVGDAEFQKKCLGKMSDVARDGRTVLFVSHNMGAIQELTERCLLIDHGRVVDDGDSAAVVERYLREIVPAESSTGRHETQLPELTIASAEMVGLETRAGYNAPLAMEVVFETSRPVEGLRLIHPLRNSLGARIMVARTEEFSLPTGRSTVRVVLEDNHLPPGSYTLGLNLLAQSQKVFTHQMLLSFELPEVGVGDAFLVQHRDRLGIYLPARVEVSSAGA